MAVITWDAPGQRKYETGTKKGVLYPLNNGTYPKGVAWNGLTGVSENPSGAEETALWADDTKYLSLRSNEQFGATVTAYTYPDEFAACNGEFEWVEGVTYGQQPRQTFGMSYVTTVGNDQEGEAYGYKIHLVYGATASPSSKDYKTINDSPEAIEFSWEISTVPVEVPGALRPVAHVIVDSTKLESSKLKALEDILYGTESDEPRLPLPTEFATIFGERAA